MIPWNPTIGTIEEAYTQAKAEEYRRKYPYTVYRLFSPIVVHEYCG